MSVLLFVITILVSIKFLALVQRIVGPNFVGYKGRLQYLADALKLFFKNAVISVWEPSLSIFDIEHNIVYASFLSVLFGLCIILTSYFSKNKYAVLAFARVGVFTLNLENFLGY